MTRTRFAAAVVTLATTLTATAPLAGAQTTPPPALSDARWAAWLGCWRAADDPSANGTRTCVVPAGGGVAVRTIVGGQLVGEELRVADGAPRPVREAGCTGTETATWAADGQRVYRSAQASCGTERPRTLASASYFVPGPIWVEVQTVAHDGGTNVRISRYVRAANQKLTDGTTAALPPAGLATALVTRGWTIDEVVEASRVLPPEGVQAAISDGPTAFRLNAKSLTRLADGGVAEPVIDLMVALTYPEKFVIDRPSGGGGGGAIGMMGTGVDPFFAQVIGPAALYDCNGPYGWAFSGYWSRCAGYGMSAYGMYTGYYNGFYGGNGPYGSWIPVNIGGPATPGLPNAPAEGGGRVVNGRGYTQVRPVDTSLPGQQTADRSNGASTSDSSGNTSSGGSSSGATSSGYSGGSSMGSGGGGMAIPRPPGGGD